jgi:hypothetical protein
VERILAFIGRAERCQTLAEAAPTDIQRARFLQLAQIWLEFAKTRRQILIIEGTYKPHNDVDGGTPGDGLAALESEK